MLKQGQGRFYLYTQVGEEETKRLKAAKTVKEEKDSLIYIFELKSVGPKIFELLLDFHYINYQFTKEQGFTNEKVSTFLAICNYTQFNCLENKSGPKEAMNLFTELMTRHSSQKPPMSIALFTLNDQQASQKFFLNSFYRHFPLYEYAFKPRVELTLQTHKYAIFNKVPSLDMNGVQEIDPQLDPRLAKFILREEDVVDVEPDSGALKVDAIGALSRRGSRICHNNETDITPSHIDEDALEPQFKLTITNKLEGATLGLERKLQPDFDKLFKKTKKK